MQTLREKIGQMIMVGCQGESLGRDEQLIFAEYDFGGFILFKKNCCELRQILSLCRRLWHGTPSWPPFIAIDEEGGSVHRLPPPFSHFPAAAIIAARNDPTRAQTWHDLAHALAQGGKPAEARRAVELVVEPLPAVFSIDDSLARTHTIWGADNVFKSYLVEKGDVDAAWAEAALVVEGTYETGAQEQLYIEPQGMLAVASPEAGVTVWGSLQCPYYVHKALVPIFGLAKERVRVVQTATGGRSPYGRHTSRRPATSGANPNAPFSWWTAW